MSSVKQIPLITLIILVLPFIISCGGSTSEETPVVITPPSTNNPPDPQVDLIFRDVTADSGIQFTTGFTNEMANNEIHIILPSGAAVGDYDNDGDLDLFIVRGDLGPNLLYRNIGNLRFEEVAEQAGVISINAEGKRLKQSSPIFVDLDGDRDLDLLIPGLDGDQTVVYANNGDTTFTDISMGSGLDTMQADYSMSPSVGDYDLDGDLDIMFGHWGTPRDYVNGVGDTEHLWRNDSTESHIFFTSVSVEAGIAPTIILNPDPLITQRVFDNTFTPTFAHINNDLYPDLVVTGDFNFSQVFINNTDGTFSNITQFDVIIDGNGMGSAVADYDGDGDMDWFVSSVKAEGDGVPSQLSRIGNRLYRNDNGNFTDITEAANVASGGWGWGSCFIDFENDGDLDIYQTNGWPDYDEFGGFSTDPSKAFISNGDGTFVNKSGDIGLGDTEQGRGVICADFDGDGDVDILQLHVNAQNSATLYENTSDSNHYLSVDLIGNTSNTAAVGARITLSANNKDYVRDVMLGSNFASHNPTQQVIGIGEADSIQRLHIAWPDGTETVLDNLDADQHLIVEQPLSDTISLQVIQGAGAGSYQMGDVIIISANNFNEAHYHFSHWTSNDGGVFAESLSANTTFTMPNNPAQITAHFIPGPANINELSVARQWNEVLLQAIRNDYARPTVHARNLFHISAAMYDSWVAYNLIASPWLLGRTSLEEVCEFNPAIFNSDSSNIAETISYAAFRLIKHRFKSSPGVSQIIRDIQSLMSARGLDLGNDSLNYANGGAELGNYLADCYIRFGLVDGSNEANDYANLHYQPINPPLSPATPGNPDIIDLNRWQPLLLEQFIDQSGNLVTDPPAFLSPEWGTVYPFSLTSADLTIYQRGGSDYWVYHDPGLPPLIDSEIYKKAFSMVSIWSAHLDPMDGVMIDISPSSIGNISTFPMQFVEHPNFYNFIDGGDWGIGYDLNPVTNKPYEPQIVPRGDYARVLAEFWADGPDSETPPGHWFVLLNEVSDHELLEKRFEGTGDILSELEWDIKAYFALGGAMHDAAITAWGVKGWYDYIRPISSIRAMADLGQSSDIALPSFNQDGIPLYDGYIELVNEGDQLAGENKEHVGKIKLYAWKGPDFINDPEMDVAGVDWILAENWWPYQRPSFVTPPFAGYVSGHSTYSRAAAEIMTAITGNAFFPGGMSSFSVLKNQFLVFEDGPSVDMTLQWATYRDASDQCSLSRIWGGIHPSLDDIPGRLMGEQIGIDAFSKAKGYFSGKEN